MRTHALVIAAALAVGAVLVPTTAQARAGTYHVECGAGNQGRGSAGNPWNSLAAVNGHGAFAPDDQILFKRGTSCDGQLIPAGSGSAGHPIVVGAYGFGAKPTIDGGGTGK